MSKERDLFNSATAATGAKLSKDTLALLARLLIDNGVNPSKLHELVFAQENGHNLSEHSQGPDMFEADTGRPIEHKAVTVTAKKPGSINFPLPARRSGEQDRTYRDRVFATQVAKGRVVAQIKNGRGAEIARFEFAAETIADFISNHPSAATGCGKIVINVSLCKKCQNFHRLENIRAIETRRTPREHWYDRAVCKS